MTKEEIIGGLQFTVDMFLFDPNTGETYTEPRNDMDKTTIDACKGAIELLEQTRWIPVSERLPEEGQWVMVTFDGKIAVCIAHDNDGTLREATSLVLKNATEIWLYPEPEWGDGYAAWMPLPEPYREERREE